MSTPLPVKRRKLNNSSANLTRPFVSPLKTANPSLQPAPRSNISAKDLTYQPSTHAHTIRAPPGVVADAKSSKTLRSTPAKSTPLRKQQSLATIPKRKDPAEQAAQKALTALELQIRSIRNEIDVLKQAAQITDSTTDAALEDLTVKWKHAAQSAAEELFGTVKERVCRMGGVAAWRESEWRKYDRSNGLEEFAQEPEESDGADCEFDSQGEELPEEEQECRRRMKKKAKQEMMDAVEVESGIEKDKADGTVKTWQEPGSDDDTFTMDMMLRSLNIELDDIGYDKDMQSWIC